MLHSEMIYVRIGKTLPEIRGGQVTQHAFVTVSCELCKDVLFTGKHLGAETEEHIWRVIRAHHGEHLARQ
jgi:hypothetical protein